MKPSFTGFLVVLIIVSKLGMVRTLNPVALTIAVVLFAVSPIQQLQFERLNAENGWKEFKKNLSSGFHITVTSKFEKSSSQGRNWDVVVSTIETIGIEGENSLVVSNSTDFQIMNESYWARIRDASSDSIGSIFHLEDFGLRNEYKFFRDQPFLRETSILFEGTRIESIDVSTFLNSFEVEIVSSSAKTTDHGEKRVNLEFNVNDYEVDSFNRISGNGSVTLLPEKNWVISESKVNLKSVINPKAVKAGEAAQWSELCEVERINTFATVNGRTVPKLQTVEYRPKKYDWRKHTWEFSDAEFLSIKEQTYLPKYGIVEPNNLASQKHYRRFWLIFLVAGLGIAFFIAYRRFMLR